MSKTNPPYPVPFRVEGVALGAVEAGAGQHGDVGADRAAGPRGHPRSPASARRLSPPRLPSPVRLVITPGSMRLPW